MSHGGVGLSAGLMQSALRALGRVADVLGAPTNLSEQSVDPGSTFLVVVAVESHERMVSCRTVVQER